MVEVTQADRDLLISLFRLTADGNAAAKINRGLTFTGEVEEIAAYRLAYVKAALEAAAATGFQRTVNGGTARDAFDAIRTIDPASVEVKP